MQIAARGEAAQQGCRAGLRIAQRDREMSDALRPTDLIKIFKNLKGSDR
jgi:hypothetical protein